MIHDSHVVGVTTNPTIFAKAISGSDHYDAQISELAAAGSGVEKALRMITIRDVSWACDVLRPAYDRSGAVDGRVSIEVDPRLAHDTERTIAEARRLWLAGGPAQPVHQDPGDDGRACLPSRPAWPRASAST